MNITIEQLIACVQKAREQSEFHSHAYVDADAFASALRELQDEAKEMSKISICVSRDDRGNLIWIIPNEDLCDVCGKEMGELRGVSPSAEGPRKFHPSCASFQSEDYRRGWHDCLAMMREKNEQKERWAQFMAAFLSIPGKKPEAKIIEQVDKALKLYNERWKE